LPAALRTWSQVWASASCVVTNRGRWRLWC
jgi:hypothetical protein